MSGAAQLPSPSASAIVDSVRAACAQVGFDLVQPLRVGWYNAQVQGSLRLEDYGSEQHLAIVIGNTRALWPVWLEVLASDPELAACPDPLDTYTERCLARVALALGVPATLRFAHEAGERCVAMQRLAHAAGLAYLTETHLSVHPTYGPWIALRAALTLPIPGPAGPEPALAHPCGSCLSGCRPAFERALAALAGPPSQASLLGAWQLWADFRGACPTGRQHRYPEAMLRYHYTKDRELLQPRGPDPQPPAQRTR
jgi:methylmalonic aciduria homocystinuria type C protein